MVPCSLCGHRLTVQRAVVRLLSRSRTRSTSPTPAASSLLTGGVFGREGYGRGRDTDRGVSRRAVLLIVSRACTWWRIRLVAAMGVAFLLVLAVPWLQDFSALKLIGVTMPCVAAGVAVVAAATLELRVEGGRPPLPA